MCFVWTDEQVAQMKRLLKDGLSCTQVGARLGCSRNAVIGKVHRIEKATGESWFRAKGTRYGPQVRPLDAKPRKAPVRPAKPTLVSDPVQSRPPQPKPLPRRAPPLPAAITIKGFKLVEIGTQCGILQTSGCRWAVGYDHTVIGRHIFCNAEIPEGQCYCDAHRQKGVTVNSPVIVRTDRDPRLKAVRRLA